MIHPPLRPWLAAGFALTLAMTLTAAAQEQAAPAFGDVVQLAPFVVNGKKLSISIHARTPADRRYAEKFAEEVVEITYETLGDATGNGLVIIGREGEPHPISIFKKFLAMAAAGQLDPAVTAKAGEVTAMLADLKTMGGMDEDKDRAPTEEETDEEPREKQAQEKAVEKEVVVKLTLDMVLPALPLPLEGVGSKLYQLAWGEDFDAARIEQKLRTLTVSDLESDALSKYTWVFYLPPRNAYVGVQSVMMKEVVQQQKLGLFKRAAMKSALFVFKPAIKKAVEGMRKSVLFMTVLRAESAYSKEDIKYLSGAYMKVLMPDFKFNGGTEHQRALEAIEAQKLKNIEYAKDPFVSPARLTEFDPAAYAAFEGEYNPAGAKPKGVFYFKRKGGVYTWQYQGRRKLVFHPAGDRLLVSSNGKLTLEFQVDATGAVTGVEQRFERRRVTFPRKLQVR